ncbi:MAG: hypothetical protein D6729_04770, partial [Deltaproteobacteria bacterium]
MLIEATLLAENRPIVEGLTTGRLKRFGGVVRDASTGRIVRHLMEAPGTSEVLMKAPMPNLLGGTGSVANAVVNAVGYGVTIHKLNAVQKTLSSVLQLSQVSAAASVLNLGISLAGFAYMGYKLNQLEKAMSAMQERMEAGFDRIDAKLDAIAGQLGYLLLLAEGNASEQRRIRDSLAELHRAVLVAELAELQSWLDQLSRFPDDSPKDAIRCAGKVRRTLSDQAVRATPQFEPRVMLVTDIAIRGWVVATATEANLLMRMGRHRDARQLIEEEQPRFARLAAQWAEALLADDRPQLRTALRFEAPRFRAFILPERVERIVRLHPPDRGLTEERRRRASKEAALEFEMSYNTGLDDDWTRCQLAVAEYLDAL